MSKFKLIVSELCFWSDEVFLSVTPFCYDPPLHFLQNRFSFLNLFFISLEIALIKSPSIYFSKNNFTTIPILYPQLLKTGIIQIPWGFVAYSVSFSFRGTLFWPKIWEQENPFPVTLENPAWRSRGKTKYSERISVSPALSLVCMQRCNFVCRVLLPHFMTRRCCTLLSGFTETLCRNALPKNHICICNRTSNSKRY